MSRTLDTGSVSSHFYGSQRDVSRIPSILVCWVHSACRQQCYDVEQLLSTSDAQAIRLGTPSPVTPNLTLAETCYVHTTSSLTHNPSSAVRRFSA